MQPSHTVLRCYFTASISRRTNRSVVASAAFMDGCMDSPCRLGRAITTARYKPALAPGR